MIKTLKTGNAYLAEFQKNFKQTKKITTYENELQIFVPVSILSIK